MKARKERRGRRPGTAGKNPSPAPRATPIPASCGLAMVAGAFPSNLDVSNNSTQPKIVLALHRRVPGMKRPAEQNFLQRLCSERHCRNSLALLGTKIELPNLLHPEAVSYPLDKLCKEHLLIAGVCLQRSKNELIRWARYVAANPVAVARSEEEGEEEGGGGKRMMAVMGRGGLLHKLGATFDAAIPMTWPCPLNSLAEIKLREHALRRLPQLQQFGLETASLVRSTCNTAGAKTAGPKHFNALFSAAVSGSVFSQFNPTIAAKISEITDGSEILWASYVSRGGEREAFLSKLLPRIEAAGFPPFLRSARMRAAEGAAGGVAGGAASPMNNIAASPPPFCDGGGGRGGIPPNSIFPSAADLPPDQFLPKPGQEAMLQDELSEISTKNSVAHYVVGEADQIIGLLSSSSFCACEDCDGDSVVKKLVPEVFARRASLFVVIMIGLMDPQRKGDPQRAQGCSFSQRYIAAVVETMQKSIKKEE